jgi:hypothetical protein
MNAMSIIRTLRTFNYHINFLKIDNKNGYYRKSNQQKVSISNKIQSKNKFLNSVTNTHASVHRNIQK